MSTLLKEICKAADDDKPNFISSLLSGFSMLPYLLGEGEDEVVGIAWIFRGHHSFDSLCRRVLGARRAIVLKPADLLVEHCGIAPVAGRSVANEHDQA